VRANLVVVTAPGLDHRDGFGTAAEVLQVEALVTKTAIEAFVGAVLPWFAGRDVRGDVAPS
jgi:hypothetical protein